MEIKVKFKAIDYYTGKTKYFIKKYQCPDFETISSKEILGTIFPETTIESQIIEWLDKQDKSSLIIEKDLLCILDYWIYEKQNKKIDIIDLLKQSDISEDTLNNLLAIYNKIYPILKNKSLKSQIDILFSHFEIGNIAILTAYKNIEKILKKDNKLKKLKAH